MTANEEHRAALLPTFLPDAGDRLRRLRRGLSELEETSKSGLLCELVREAHTLKGSSATVGIEQVSSLAEALETALEAKDLELARTSLDSLTSELTRVGVSSRTVLCIEDDPTSLLLVQRVAARTPGVRLLSAQTGREGLELAQRERPDLELLDIVLPDVPGDEVLRRLRGDPVTADIPVVVLSANARPERAAEVFAAGATEYVTKPLDVEQLIALIQKGPE